ncbi:MAG: DUF1015 domain-containing protein [Clostridiales bacterium]|nr:DUF1015 domain-containing protein [Clostridiales bacterium]
MKKRGNLRKRLTALLLSACVALGAVPVYQYNTVEAEAADVAGEVAGGIFEKLIDFALEQVDRVLIYSLSDVSDEDSTGLNILLSFMRSPEENALERVEELCEEILYDVEILMEKVDVITEQNQEILVVLDQLEKNSYYSTISHFQAQYKDIYDDYVEAVEAMQVYADDPTDENLVKVETKMVPLQTFYENCKDGTIPLTSDIMDYALAISSYQPSSTLQSEDEWEEGSENTSYLTAVIQYSEDTRVSQEQVHDDLEATLNYVVMPFYYYLLCLNLYTAMDLYEINSDTSLTATERQVQLNAANELQEKLENYGYNAINQAAYECSDILTTWRGLDDEESTVIDMTYYADYNEAQHDLYDYSDYNNLPPQLFDGKAAKTSDSMEVSFVTALDGTTYAIRTDGGINPSLTMQDMTHKGSTYYYLSTDFANMLSGAGNWSSLSLIYEETQLNSLLTQGSYYLCSNDFINYMRTNGNNDNIFGAVNGSDVALTSNIWEDAVWLWDKGQTGIYEINVHDLYVDATEVKDNSHEMYLKGDESLSVWIYYFEDGNDAVSYSCEVTDGAGGSSILTEKDSTEALENENGIYSVLSGESYTLKVKPDDGYKAVSAVMYKYDSYGEKVELESYDLSDMKNVQSPDEDGYYSVTTYASPYRDVIWEITYEEDTEGYYLVTLEQPSLSEASIQFSLMPGVDSSYYTNGSEVVLYVRPESHYVCTGITVTTESGGTVDVLDADDSQMILACGSGTVGYVFTMPEENVTVTASLGTGYEVSLTTRGSGSGSLYFTDSYGKSQGTANDSKTYVSGSTVYIKAEADSDSHLSGLIVQGVSSQKTYEYTEKNGLISLTAPDDEDIVVTGEFTQSNSYLKTVEVLSTGNGSAKFLNVASEDLSEHDYFPGRTVTILVTPDEGGEILSVTVTDTSGNTFAGVSVEPYEDDTSACLITFTMQDYKVEVNVEFTSVTTVSLETDHYTSANICDADDSECVLAAAVGTTVSGILSEGTYHMTVYSAEGAPTVQVSRNSESAQTISCTSNGDGTYSCDITAEEHEDGESEQLDITVNAAREIIYISTWEELKQALIYLRTDENGAKATYILTNDIDGTGQQDVLGYSGDASTYSPEPEEGTYYFSGIFDGNGYTISNVTVNERGLFGILDGAVIRNFEISNAEMSVEGTLAGLLAVYVTGSGCRISSVRLDSSVSVICYNDSVWNAGGLLGMVYENTGDVILENCESELLIQGNYALYVGGLIGSCLNCGNVLVYNSRFSGTISMESLYAGGIVGSVHSIDQNFPSPTLTAANVYADGTITVTEDTAKADAICPPTENSLNESWFADGTVTLDHAWYLSGLPVSRIRSQAVESSEMTDGTLLELLNEYADGYGDAVGMTWVQDDEHPVLTGSESTQYLYTASLDADSTDASLTVYRYNNLVSGDVLAEGSAVTACVGDQITCSVMPAEDEAGTLQVCVYRKDGSLYTCAGYTWNSNAGCYEAGFLMPGEDVTVSVSYDNEDEYMIDTEVTPDEDGSAWITDADGNEITSVSKGETVYLNVDLREGYAVQSILLYSGSSSAYYKAVEVQSDDSGRYAFTVDGAEAGKLVTVSVQLGAGTYTITTKNQGTGFIQLSDTTAQMGDTIHVRAVPTDGYFVSDMYLEDGDGNKISSLWVEYNSAGYSETEFTMPGKNTVVCTVFTSKSYTVEVETNDENVSLTVQDEDGNNINRARTDSTVTVSWDLNKVMIESLTVCADDDSRTVINELDITGNRATFTMPSENVVIVAEADETEYLLNRATEGEGYVMLNDLTTFDKTEGKAGQTIFAALYPAEGWELMEGSQVIDAEGNVLAELSESKKYAVFTMPQSDITLTGGFTAIDYTITVEAADYETIEVLKDDETVTAAHKDDVLTVQAASDSDENPVSVICTYEYGGETRTLTAALYDGAAEITMPAADVTITASYTDYDFDTDEDGVYLISDFETLTDVAKAIQAEPDIYASASYRLTNPIHADGAEWTLPIGTADVPFVGTFDGAGYFLIDYVIDTDEDNMAIFGVVGEGGSVLNMGATMGTITSAGNLVAELVAVNYGTVNGCYSGCALTSGSITLKDGNVHSLSELNTTVTGAAGAAGLVAENYGTVINSRSHSSVSGLNAGGLVLYNYGTIENAYNYGSVTGTLSAGGIAGENEGSIFNVYDTGKITSSGTAGVITAVNTGTVSDEAYYDHDQASAPSCCEVGTAMDLKAMKKDTFTDTLNANITEAEREDLYEWIRSSDKNGGYPRISSPVVVSQTLTSASLNLSVSGTMHQEASLEATALTEESEAYEAFAAYAGEENTILRTADAALIYINGDYAEYDGGLTVTVNSVPDSLENVKLLKYSDGEVSEVTFEKSGDTCTLEVQELVPVALVATAASDTDDGTEATADAAGDSDTSDSGRSSGSSSSGSGTSKVKTGDSDLFLPMIGLILAATAAGGVCAAKKRRRERA